MTNFFRGYIFEEEIVNVFMQLLSKISDYINVLDVIRYLNHACYDPSIDNCRKTYGSILLYTDMILFILGPRSSCFFF